MKPRFSSVPRLKFWIIVITGAIVILICLAVFSALSARSHGLRALRDFEYVQNHLQDASTISGRLDLQHHLIDAIEQSKDADRALTSTVVLSAVQWIPYFGNEVTGASKLFGDSSSAASSGLRIVSALGRFQNGTGINELSNSNLDSLQNNVASALSIFSKIDRPVGSLFGPVGRERALFDHKAMRAIHELEIANDALDIGKSILGNEFGSNLLILPENNAEMRDQGMILSYSLVSVEGSTFRVIRTGHSYDLDLPSPLKVPLSPGAKTYFEADGPSQYWRLLNLGANFRWSASTGAAMFKRATGESVTDVIALDVPAMAQLLEVTGPLRVQGIPEVLTSKNFSTVVLHDLYSQFAEGSQLPRYADLSEISVALLERIKTSHHDLIAFVRALAHEIPGRHLLLWSAHPFVESAIVGLGASGEVNTVLPNRTFHVAVESDVAAKMDYYIHVNETYNVILQSNGAARVLTTVKLHNDAPTGQSPSYQLGPDNIISHVPGQYVSNIYFWSPAGSFVTGGEPDSGLVLNGFSSNVLPQQSSFTYFDTFIPNAVTNGKFRIHLVPQPTLYPTEVIVKVHGYGWSIVGPPEKSFQLTSPTTLSYVVSN